MKRSASFSAEIRAGRLDPRDAAHGSERHDCVEQHRRLVGAAGNPGEETVGCPSGSLRARASTRSSRVPHRDQCRSRDHRADEFGEGGGRNRPFRSPLMIGGNLPSNDEWTTSLLTNADVIEFGSTLQRKSSRDFDEQHGGVDGAE